MAGSRYLIYVKCYSFFKTGAEIVNSLSGGGFSDYFARPSYQSAAVQGYLAKMAYVGFL